MHYAVFRRVERHYLVVSGCGGTCLSGGFDLRIVRVGVAGIARHLFADAVKVVRPCDAMVIHAGRILLFEFFEFRVSDGGIGKYVLDELYVSAVVGALEFIGIYACE